MTVVLEDQVRTIADEIAEKFGGNLAEHYYGAFDKDVSIVDVVRAVIAQYDISNIARLEPPILTIAPPSTKKRANSEDGKNVFPNHRPRRF
jgi:hypothetical protein